MPTIPFIKVLPQNTNLQKPKHAFIAEIMKKAEKITQKYAGSFDWKVAKISEADLAETVQFIFQCDTGALVEL